MLPPHNNDAPPSMDGSAPAEEVRLSPQEVALFLDVDGSILELAGRPESVSISPALRQLLRGWLLRGGGALALISGRSLEDLDGLFGDLLLPAAGLHGFERRNALGVYSRHMIPADASVQRVRRLLANVASRNPGLLLEDKRFALALHYRLAPHLEREVVADVMAIARRAAKDFEIQRGKMVIELRPKGATKGVAVEEFMGEPPFRGRVPAYFGDDLTDESAFEWVNAHGGISVAVDAAHHTVARFRLDGVAQTHACLARSLALCERSVQ